jgi:hypothetical protein
MTASGLILPATSDPGRHFCNKRLAAAGGHRTRADVFAAHGGRRSAAPPSAVPGSSWSCRSPTGPWVAMRLEPLDR